MGHEVEERINNPHVAAASHRISRRLLPPDEPRAGLAGDLYRSVRLRSLPEAGGGESSDVEAAPDCDLCVPDTCGDEAGGDCRGFWDIGVLRGEQCGGEDAGADRERRRDCQPVSAHTTTAPKMSQEQT